MTGALSRSPTCSAPVASPRGQVRRAHCGTVPWSTSAIGKCAVQRLSTRSSDIESWSSARLIGRAELRAPLDCSIRPVVAGPDLFAAGWLYRQPQRQADVQRAALGGTRAARRDPETVGAVSLFALLPDAGKVRGRPQSPASCFGRPRIAVSCQARCVVTLERRRRRPPSLRRAASADPPARCAGLHDHLRWGRSNLTSWAAAVRLLVVLAALFVLVVLTVHLVPSVVVEIGPVRIAHR